MLIIPTISNCKIIIKNFIFVDPQIFLKAEAGLHTSFHCTTIEISSNNNSDANISVEYDNDETLDIKDVILLGMSTFEIKISQLNI